MKRSPTRTRSLYPTALFVMSLTAMSAVAAACADSESQRIDPGPDGRTPSPLPDASSGDAGVDADARAPGPVDRCSAAGWCATDVDPRLSFDDLWPLEHSAVAIASLAGRSSVLAYEDESWKVIRQEPFLLASVWASPHDVWVSGRAGYVAHGHREGDDWRWTAHPLPVSSTVSGVWGTGRREVYALADARVWRLSLDADGGPPEAGQWVVDYGGDSAPDPETTLTALVGRSEDDIWVTGVRGTFVSCGLVAHKTNNAWVSVVDGMPTLPPEPMDPPTCEPSGGAIALPSPFGKATTTAAGELVALTEVGRTAVASFARIRHHADGGAELTLTPRTRSVKSLWGASADDLYAASFSLVERGRNVWTDGGSWEVSTVAFDGIAIAKPCPVGRGTRSDNLWLAGESYVFHKTSP